MIKSVSPEKYNHYRVTVLAKVHSVFNYKTWQATHLSKLSVNVMTQKLR